MFVQQIFINIYTLVWAPDFFRECDVILREHRKQVEHTSEQHERIES